MEGHFKIWLITWQKKVAKVKRKSIIKSMFYVCYWISFDLTRGRISSPWTKLNLGCNCLFTLWDSFKFSKVKSKTDIKKNKTESKMSLNTTVFTSGKVPSYHQWTWSKQNPVEVLQRHSLTGNCTNLLQ